MAQVQSPLLTRYQDISFPKNEFREKVLCAFPSGWQGEQTLDVQSAHSIAPGAKILYSGGFNCSGGLDLAVSKILDHGSRHHQQQLRLPGRGRAARRRPRR